LRFPQETCAAIHEAYPNPITVKWPAGEAEPQKGRVYRLQKDEEVKAREQKAKDRRDYSPETHAEVMAKMEAAWYGGKPRRIKKKKRRHDTGRSFGDALIMVVDVEPIGPPGRNQFEVKAVLYMGDPDPVRHTGLKTKVHGGPDPITKAYEATELEPEEMLIVPSRREREEGEDAIAIEHRVSVDPNEEVRRAEQHIKKLRAQGKRSVLAEQAVERAKRRFADGVPA
jgi:hypothetical protein